LRVFDCVVGVAVEKVSKEWIDSLRVGDFIDFYHQSVSDFFVYPSSIVLQSIHVYESVDGCYMLVYSGVLVK
jgi:hypothetical protein